MADPGHERRLRELFDRALSLPPAEREALLTDVGDELLAERLRALLAQDAQGTAGVLQRPADAGMQALRRIGNYEVLRELGRGGMGTVVLARQVEPVERLVAMKLVHGGGDGGEVERRFATERQALAMMDHPGIAQMFDGGTTADGSPYFVMEYVRGEPITAYCDRRQLGCDARIDLFVKVCEAVQHAHQKAILHRDLKPGNVLVTEAGGSPQPKVIDFGVARALTGGVGPQQLTSGGAMVGTLAYMSPEQADPRGQGVDTRTDVYSLGVLLYQLLTGELPLDLDVEKAGLLGVQRALLETPTPPASTRVAALPGEQQQQRAHARGTQATKLHRQLQGDLDWILMRALEKDRNRRYGSAAELAADLQRHRRNEPVEAGPPTARYRFARFVRRHRATVLAATLVLLGLVGGAIGATYGMFAAEAARGAEARISALKTRQLEAERARRDFFEFVMFHGDPGTGSNPLPLRQVLDQLAATIAPRLAGRPAEAAAVHAGFGRAYLTTGEPAKAAAQLQQARQLLVADGEQDAAEACMVRLDLGLAKRLAGGEGPDDAELAAMLELGARALDRIQPATAQLLQQLATRLRQPGDPQRLQTGCEQLVEHLGKVARTAGDHAAWRLAGRLLAAVAMHLQEDEPPRGPDANAERRRELFARMEAMTRQILGDDVDLLQTLGRFAENQLRQGQFEDARRLSSDLLQGLDRLALHDHWLQLRGERIRGLALALSGEPAAGETALLALRQRLDALPPTANSQARAAANALVELADLLARRGQLETFLAASLGRWQVAANADPTREPWWPADVEGLGREATTAARTAVEQAIGQADAPVLQGLRGSLLLRLDLAEAAEKALAAAVAALPQPPPELLADLAIAHARTGHAAAAAAIAATLRSRCEQAAAGERGPRALRRIAAAGLR